MPNHDIDSLLIGVKEILPGGAEALAARLASGKKLRVKLGIDPTAPDLHLGHTVCLNILQRFAEAGHQPVLLIGGFTAQLGDPSGRNEARPPLSPEEVVSHASHFLEQASSVVDLERCEVVNNADWLSKLSSSALITLASSFTVNQMIAKEAFGERLEKGQPLYLHEMLYPLLQGYDSVQIRADLELGGSDQRFNVLAGRDLQRQAGQEPQLVALLPLLIGLDGQKKMSKTAGNHIALRDTASDFFGKTMSLPDAQMLAWFELLLGVSAREVQAYPEVANPRDLKMRLARELTSKFKGAQAAQEAQEDFVQRFQRRELPSEIPLHSFQLGQSLVQVLNNSGSVSSNGEARRLIAGGGVKVNEKKADEQIVLKAGDVLQVGKRKFLKLQAGES